MEFPQILYLPKGGALTSNGLLRLDQLQSVYHAHMEPTQYALSDTVKRIVQSQLQFLFTGEAEASDYTELRDLLMDPKTA